MAQSDEDKVHYFDEPHKDTGQWHVRETPAIAQSNEQGGEELLDKLVDILEPHYWNQGFEDGKEGARKSRTLIQLENLILADRKQHELEAIKQANNEGHWFAGEKQSDAYWNFVYFCNCGFKAKNRQAVDGHVEWKKAALKAELEAL